MQGICVNAINCINENLMSRYKSLIASLYVKPPKEAELAALKERNIKLIFWLKAQKQVFKQKLKQSHNRTRQEKLNLMRTNCLKAETYVRLFSRVPRQVRETERRKLQNL